uniref:Galactosylgalactosylxylosylprotein 3-beta-glucuronosyltransferase n=1 Tax=Molossus molossus TaxID=27622 RepID=A0A7J8GPI2_MOLMO|nr:beta-1,3-glucuronyltransferase 2 [Molossus molossus]
MSRQPTASAHHGQSLLTHILSHPFSLWFCTARGREGGRDREKHRPERDASTGGHPHDPNWVRGQTETEMRTTRKVSVWPVGLVGGRRYERPLVENGKVVGWYTGWRADRPFAIDMAGFAVSLQVILSNPKAVFKRRGSQPGMQESDFLKQITTVEELEPKANNCTKVFISHVLLDLVACRCSESGCPKHFPPLPLGSCVAHSDREG